MALDLLLAALALVGHAALFLSCFNRLHAVGLHRRTRRRLELLLVAFSAGVILWYGGWWIVRGIGPFAAWQSGAASYPGYASLCVVAAAALIPCWLWPKLLFRPPTQLSACEVEVIDVQALVGPIPLRGQATFFARFPGNEFLKLQISRKTLHLAGLPAALEGLTITHLSDLHFTGDIGQQYFDCVVDQANHLQSDVLVLSGDIIESTSCETWIPQTLGRLTAPLGKYYVLGNHDKRMPDVQHARQLLDDAGLIYLGGTCLHADWRSCRVLLAGNERPWFPAASDDDLVRTAGLAEPAGFRLLVSHSPDQFSWARQRGFSLMLAGHNHGGQVRLPLIGPLVSPSLHGTRYSGGVYYQPPTLLHVSRGISGEHPLRWNCLPEVTQLVLQGDSSSTR
jgi:predicted MPP superfamily phosphohydrolase